MANGRCLMDVYTDPWLIEANRKIREWRKEAAKNGGQVEAPKPESRPVGWGSAPCGTAGGWARHRRLREQQCVACKEWKRAHSAAYKAAQKAVK